MLECNISVIRLVFVRVHIIVRLFNKTTDYKKEQIDTLLDLGWEDKYCLCCLEVFTSAVLIFCDTGASLAWCFIVTLVCVINYFQDFDVVLFSLDFGIGAETVVINNVSDTFYGVGG